MAEIPFMDYLLTMDGWMTYLTLGQASRETGAHKSTISRAIQDGRLSASHNQHGHYQIDPAELFRVFDPVSKATPDETERNPAQPLHQETATPSSREPEMVPWLVKRLERAEQELEQTQDELRAREQSLEELREAYRALPSPEAHDAEVTRLRSQHQREIDEREAEKVRLIAMERQQHEKQNARELLSQRLADLESRSFLARLMNRKPKTITAE